MIGVTSFSEEGYEQYGKHFLETVHYFPGKVLVYTEVPMGLSNDQVEEKNLFDIPGIYPFMQNIKDVPKARGLLETGYNYNFDLWKFCRKMFCQFDNFTEGKVFWLDADLRIKKPIPGKWLDNLLSGEPLVFLGRKDFHTETGFVGFDTNHSDFNKFAQRYVSTLQNGKIFELDRWHDCEAFDWARMGMGNDLSPFWMIGDDLHVFPKTVLDEYITHYKGPLKNDIH